MLRAFRDTWELGIHSYLTYLRDRLLTNARAVALRADRSLSKSATRMSHTFAKYWTKSSERKNCVADHFVWKEKHMPHGGRFIERNFDYFFGTPKNIEQALEVHKLFIDSGNEAQYEGPELALWVDFKNGETEHVATDDRRSRNHCCYPTRTQRFIRLIGSVVGRRGRSRATRAFRFQGTKDFRTKGQVVGVGNPWRRCSDSLLPDACIQTDEGFGISV